MRPGREMDARIAKEVFGYRVWAQGKILFENAPLGDRPLRAYSKEMQWAHEVLEKMRITLIPIQGGQWFAFSGPAAQEGWESPQALLQFLEAAQFDGCGAATGDKLPLLICEAALRAIEKRGVRVPHLEIATSEIASSSSSDASADRDSNTPIH